MVLDVAAQEAVQAVDATDVLELVERDEGAIATRRLEARRQVEERVQRRQRVAGRLELEPRADPERPQREPDPGSLEERLDTPPELALQVLRVRALEPDRHVGDGGDAVQVDEHRNEPFASLAVVERPLEQARLAVLAGRVQSDVVATDDVAEELAHLFLAVDDILGRHRA